MMSKCKYNILLVGLTILMSVLLAACSSHAVNDLDDEEGNVFLSLNIMPMASRSGDELLCKSDMMHNLRIVILNESGTRVLANQLLPLGGDVIEAHTPFYKVDAGSTLQIYLLANCTDYQFGDDVNFDNSELYTSGKINELTFTFNTGSDVDRYVPMTRKLSISIPSRSELPADGKYYYPNPLYVIRAVNKLSVEFYNNSGDDIDVKSYTLSKINNEGTTFLVPNVTQKSWFEILFEQAKGEAVPAEDYNWIRDYNIPECTHTEYTFADEVSLPKTNTDCIKGKSWLFPESKYMENAMQGLQFYNFSVITSRGTFSTANLLKPYLQNLCSLFRDTHVIIKVTFDKLGCQIDVQPYQEYAVGVDFGLKRNNLGDLMVELDKDGKYSHSFQVYLDKYKELHKKDLVPVKDENSKDIKLDKDDYYAIHVGSDGDIYSANTEVWVMDSDGCRVLSNYTQNTGDESCNARKVVYFASTSPDTGMNYFKDADHFMRLQHHADHSCIVLDREGRMLFKIPATDETPQQLFHVESWEGTWNSQNWTTTPGIFYIETKLNGETCYQKYESDGMPTNTYIYPDGTVYEKPDGFESGE